MALPRLWYGFGGDYLLFIIIFYWVLIIGVFFIAYYLFFIGYGLLE